MAKERIKSADFVRVISFAFIFIFHFYEELEVVSGRPNLLKLQANGNLAVMGNVLFFALSGAMLFLGYSNLTIKSSNSDILRFYKKRWLSLFPSFLIAWGVLYLLKAIAARNPFYNGNPLAIILSLLGLDGYLAYRVPDYYIIGEWFLGAMILIYIFFPIINYFFSKSAVCTTLVSLILSLLVLYKKIWVIDNGRNLLICIFCFILGMVYMKYRDFFSNRYVALTAAVLAVLLIIVPMPNDLYAYILLAFSMLIIMFVLGEYVMNNKTAAQLFTFLASFSYEVFLVHHIVIYGIQGIFVPNNGIMCHVLMLGTGLLSLAGGFLLHIISRGLIHGISKL